MSDDDIFEIITHAVRRGRWYYSVRDGWVDTGTNPKTIYQDRNDAALDDMRDQYRKDNPCLAGRIVDAFVDWCGDPLTDVKGDYRWGVMVAVVQRVLDEYAKGEVEE